MTSEVEREVLEGEPGDREVDLVEEVDPRVKRPLIRHGFWHLVPVLTQQQLRVKYRQSGFQLAWNVIQPVALVAVYALFFHGVLDLGSEDAPYLSFIVAGLVPWRFVGNGLGSASSLTDSIHLISRIYFPREIIPMVNTATGLVDLAVGSVIILIVALAQGIPPTYHVVALPLVFLLLILFVTGATIFVTTVSVFARDVSHGMSLILLGFFFATPIMYPVSQLPDWLRWFAAVNPLAVVVTQTREVVLFDHWPVWWLLGVHLVAATMLFFGSITYLRSVEHRMVDLA